MPSTVSKKLIKINDDIVRANEHRLGAPTYPKPVPGAQSEEEKKRRKATTTRNSPFWPRRWMTTRASFGTRS